MVVVVVVYVYLYVCIFFSSIGTIFVYICIKGICFTASLGDDVLLLLLIIELNGDLH